MRKQSGFTLIELLVVISIVALLLSIGIPAYSTWKQRHDIESEMAQLYGDLQLARSTAYANKELAGLSWSGTSFPQYQFLTNATTNSATTSVTSTGSNLVTTMGPFNFKMSAGNASQSLTFNGRGFVSAPSTLPVNFYISQSYDCVSVSLTRISLGTWDGVNCAPKWK